MRQFFHRHPVALAFVYSTITFLVALGAVQRAYDQTQRDDCKQRQEGRETLRNVIVVATTPSAGRLDLTAVPGFENLDPATQDFFRNLSPPRVAEPPTTMILNPEPDPNNKTQQQLLDRAPPITC